MNVDLRRLTTLLAGAALVSACANEPTAPPSTLAEGGAPVAQLPTLEAPTAARPEASPEPAVFPLPMLPAHPSMAELLDGKADQYDDYKNANPDTYDITAGPATPIIAEGEFEGKGNLTISWTGSFPDVVAAIVNAANPVVDITVIHYGTSAKSQFDSAMAQYGVSTSGLQYLNTPNNSIWIRDFGPVGAREPKTGRPALVDPRYYHNRVYDDAIPDKLAKAWGLNNFRMPVDFEGGNFMADGRGTCMVTQGVLWYNGVSQSAIEGYFRDYLGCYQLIVVNPLYNEGTTHIDMFSKLVDQDTVLLGEYEFSQDSTNAQLMNENEDIYNAVVLAGGGSLEVVRMPMPSNSGQQVWRTYVNSQFVNGINMIPVYTDNTAYESEALSIWQQVAPDMTHVTIDATQLITWSGAIHCILMEVPDGDWQKFQTDPPTVCNTFDCYPSDTGGNAGCGGVPVHGECNGNTAQWCEFGEVQTQTCGAGNSCAWDADAGHFGCTDGTCTPSCGGNECGNDGCGGSCGTCGAGEVCQAGSCVTEPDTGCGDITGVGCCEGSLLKYCNQQGTLVEQSCGGSGCGWSSNQNWYDCGFSGADPSGQWPLSCGGDTCEPDCAGKTCGDDGCGGSCGTCSNGGTCEAGQCVACQPQCGGKECGADGCGGSCGSCPGGQLCNAGMCEDQPQGECGELTWEGVCDASTGTVTYCEGGTEIVTVDCNTGCCGWIPDEGYQWCYPQDYCGYCVNECEPGQSGCSAEGTHQWTCVPANADWPCHVRQYVVCDGGCDAASGACATTCEPDCTGKSCGGDGCGGSCGSCGAGEVCTDKGLCEPEPCVPSCTDKECGSDGCGGNCGDCAANEACEAFQCVPGVCQPECAGKVCGSDGCGGTCGTCGADELCTASGQCEAVCVPACEGMACGDDGCGGSCGTCPQGEFCVGGQCSAECTPDCAGKACGPDGCGGSCGACAGAEICTDAGQCVEECAPQCEGKSCGMDGCGGVCGTCPSGESCSAAGQCVAVAGCGGITFEGECEGSVLTWCEDDELKSYDCAGQGKTCGYVEGTGNTCVSEDVCEADCAGKSCGPDGCGGSCGSCAEGESCNGSGQCEADGPVGNCGDVTFEGQCEGSVVMWCDEGNLQTYDCEGQGKVCGFKEGTGYTCLDADCQAECSGKQCGDDGCGGSCGSCADGQSCNNGVCAEGGAGGSGGGTGGAGGGTGTGSETDDPGDPNTGSSSGGSTSSGCHAGGGSAPWLPALLALGLLAIIRRRG